MAISRRKLNKTQGDEIAARYRAGETIGALAKAFGVSDAPIKRALKEHRVAIRGPVHRVSSR